MDINRLKQSLTTIVTLLLVGIVLVWPLVTGFVLQGKFGATVGVLSAPNHWAMKETEFKRGWFHSEARTVLTLEGELAKQMREARHTIDPMMPVQVILIHHIQHGPVLSVERPFLLPAAAFIETTMEFPDDTKDWLKPVFGDAAPVRVRSLIRLNGDVISRFESPAVDGDLTDGTHLQWQGIGGTLEMGHNWETVRGNLTMPLLALSDGAGQLRLQQLEIQLDNHRHQGGLWLGEAKAAFKTLAFMVPSHPEYRFSLTGYSAMSAFREEEQTLHALVSMDLGDFSMGGHPLGAGGFTIDLRRVDLLAFTSLYNDLKYWEQLPVAKRSAAEKQVRQTMMTQLPWLLHYSPEFGISRLEIRTPQGIVRGSLRLALNGEGDLAVVTPADILPRFSMELEANAPLNLVLDIVQTQVTKEMIAHGDLGGGLFGGDKLALDARDAAEKRLSALVDQGLLMRYTDRYSMSATYTKGQLGVNGRPHNELLEKLKGIN